MTPTIKYFIKYLLVTYCFGALWWYYGIDYEKMGPDAFPLIMAAMCLFSVFFFGLLLEVHKFFRAFLGMIGFSALGFFAGRAWFINDEAPVIVWAFFAVAAAGLIALLMLAISRPRKRRNLDSSPSPPKVATVKTQTTGVEQMGYQNRDIPTARTYQPESFSHGKNMGNIALLPQEQIVKTYHCAKSGGLLGLSGKSNNDGKLAVTTYRILFEGGYPGSRVTHEVKIDTVTGLSAYYGRKLDTRLMIAGIILFGLSAVAAFQAFRPNLFTGRASFDIWYIVGSVIALLASLICLRLCFPRVFFLTIFSSEASGAIAFGSKSDEKSGINYTMTMAPTDATDLMLSELGALIINLQTTGELVVAGGLINKTQVDVLQGDQLRTKGKTELKERQT